ncbi:murein peptide amidase A [Thalassoglobus neptunius]|uniref:Murein peptide amidase A n=1 Tax=Thalassoglobus neptunius TaxID=1938619 RepID=A0A5C5WIU8_9PLAN|nr:M14 family zinc carboxypeptidase [Thalassoglobus neptunius]TWT49953.1 murein peptide amidase A [Thalassoglobus neptunius]
MSRFPFGLCLGLVLINQGCVGISSQVSSTLEIAGQHEGTRNSQRLAVPIESAAQSLKTPIRLVSNQQRIASRSQNAEPVKRYFAYRGGPPINLGQPQPWSRSSTFTPPVKVVPEQVIPSQEKKPFEDAITSQSPASILGSQDWTNVIDSLPDKLQKSIVDPEAMVLPSSVDSSDRVVAVWEKPLQSTAGRPIEITPVGRGPLRILVVGSIYGNEPESIQLIDSFSEEVRNGIRSTQTQYLIIRTPNPDGFIDHVRTNHNGVELNRNFPSTWFTANPNRLTGPHPGSEVETQHLLRILKEFRPHRVVHIRGSIGVRPLVLVNSKLDRLRGEIDRLDQVDVGGFGGEFKAGSLEEFVSIRSGTEMATVHLPPSGFPQLTPRQLMVICETNLKEGHTQQLDESPATEVEPLAPPATEVPTAENVLPEERSPQGKKGFVEFLPPPPTPERFNNASQSEAGGDSRYYELPPPPGTVGQ